MKHIIFLIFALIVVSQCHSHAHTHTKSSKDPQTLPPPTPEELLTNTRVTSVIDKTPKLANFEKNHQVTDDEETTTGLTEEQIQERQPTSIVVDRLPVEVNTDDYEYTDMCKLKQGFVTMLDPSFIGVQKRKITVEDEEVVTEDHILKGRQVFAVLQKDSLNIFENQNANSLITQVNVRSVDVPILPQIWQKYFCFQLVGRTESFKEKAEYDDFESMNKAKGVEYDLPSNRAKISICLGNSRQLMDWVSSIYLFEVCEVSAPNSDHDESVDHSTTIMGHGIKRKLQSTISKRYKFYKNENNVWIKRVTITNNDYKKSSYKHSIKTEIDTINRLKKQRKEFEKQLQENKLTQINKEELERITKEINSLTAYIQNINGQQTEQTKVEIEVQRNYILQMDKLRRQQECDREKQEVIRKRKEFELLDSYAIEGRKKDEKSYSDAIAQIKLSKENELNKIQGLFKSRESELSLDLHKKQQQIIEQFAAQDSMSPDFQTCKQIRQQTNLAQVLPNLCKLWKQYPAARDMDINLCMSQSDDIPVTCQNCCNSFIGNKHEREQASCFSECTGDDHDDQPDDDVTAQPVTPTTDARFRFKQNNGKHHHYRRRFVRK